LGLPTLLLPSGLLIYSFVMTLSSDILSTWPNYLNLAFLISATVSNSWYSAISSLFVLILQIPLSYTGPTLSSPTFEDFSRHWLWDTRFQNHG
jgi:hypothetical protein